jgi:hypothetical protein
MVKASCECLSKAESMVVADTVRFRFIGFPSLARAHSKHSGLTFLSTPGTNPNHAISFSLSGLREKIHEQNIFTGY